MEYRQLIREFRCKNTQALFECGHPKRLRAIEAVVTCKLAMLDAQDFIRSPPGNRLEALKGDRAGQWCVRTSHPWRVAGVVRVERRRYG